MTQVSRTLNFRFKDRGTRFLIYPQPKSLKGFSRPEVVYVNAALGSLSPGPEDEAIYTVDADFKYAYAESRQRPPFRGPRLPPAEPDAEGHFDHVKPDERAFSSVTAYAIVRCVLEIWEGYLGRQLPWHFRKAYPRLELIPRAQTYNAWSGDGYLELGFITDSKPYCENFDAVAHEMGHLIGWSLVGRPKRRSMTYRANDEACADLVAIVSSLHFDAVVGHLLTHTKGNLFSANELSRIGELSKTRQARKAFNSAKMSTVRKNPDPNPRKRKYKLSLPFTGGAFDVLVGIYEQGLIDRRVISEDLCKRSYRTRSREIARVQREFAEHFKRRRLQFANALFDARDYFGRLFAKALDNTSMSARSHPIVAAKMIAADGELSGGRFGALIRQSFEWREIL